MGNFHDVIGTLDTFEGLSVPDDFATSIGGAYDADIAAVTSSADAKVAQLTAALQAAEALTQDLKAQNYDLLMAVGQPGTEDTPTEGDPAESEDDGPTSTDDLFGDDDEKEKD